MISKSYIADGRVNSFYKTIKGENNLYFFLIEMI